MEDVSKKKRGRPKKVVATDEVKKYNLFVSIGDNIIDVMTDDLAASILEIKPVKIMQRVVFKVNEGERTVEKMLFPLRAKRILFNKVAAQYFVKNLLLSMK